MPTIHQRHLMKRGTPTMKTDIHSLLRNDFLSFARKALRELDGTILSEDAYLGFLANKLTAFADGEIKRLIVNAPPRHLKSQLGTVCLAAWILGHHPNKKIRSEERRVGKECRSRW